MKLKGQTILPPQPKQIVLPRTTSDGVDGSIILLAGPVMDYNEFNRLCPQPKPPVVMRPGKKQTYDTNNAGFLKRVDEYSNRRMAYTMIKSLSFTEDLEWEIVQIDKPETWIKYEEELRKHFTEAEVMLILEGVMDANMPSAERQEEALQRFAQRQVEEAKRLSSLTEEQDSTPSTEAVNVSA